VLAVALDDSSALPGVQHPRELVGSEAATEGAVNLGVGDAAQLFRS
jgi:hypothetical protein